MPTTENPDDILKMMDDFSAACRKAGLKLTHQRYEIYQELLKSSDHPAAEVLHKRLLLKIPSMSLDTVYRTLATFEQHGLISRVQTVESHARFEARLQHHHHLICSVCNEITDFQWEGFDQSPLPQGLQEWGTVSNKQAVVYGVCSKCLSGSKN
ncbi:MAG: transcriptional repressor [Geobacter sp.]|nr:transcriptional repressor [Geobacter sp.]